MLHVKLYKIQTQSFQEISKICDDDEEYEECVAAASDYRLWGHLKCLEWFIVYVVNL